MGKEGNSVRSIGKGKRVGHAPLRSELWECNGHMEGFVMIDVTGYYLFNWEKLRSLELSTHGGGTDIKLLLLEYPIIVRRDL